MLNAVVISRSTELSVAKQYTDFLELVGKLPSECRFHLKCVIFQTYKHELGLTLFLDLEESFANDKWVTYGITLRALPPDNTSYELENFRRLEQIKSNATSSPEISILSRNLLIIKDKGSGDLVFRLERRKEFLDIALCAVLSSRNFDYSGDKVSPWSYHEDTRVIYRFACLFKDDLQENRIEAELYDLEQDCDQAN